VRVGTYGTFIWHALDARAPSRLFVGHATVVRVTAWDDAGVATLAPLASLLPELCPLPLGAKGDAAVVSALTKCNFAPSRGILDDMICVSLQRARSRDAIALQPGHNLASPLHCKHSDPCPFNVHVSCIAMSLPLAVVSGHQAWSEWANTPTPDVASVLALRSSMTHCHVGFPVVMHFPWELHLGRLVACNVGPACRSFMIMGHTRSNAPVVRAVPDNDGVGMPRKCGPHPCSIHVCLFFSDCGFTWASALSSTRKEYHSLMADSVSVRDAVRRASSYDGPIPPSKWITTRVQSVYSSAGPWNGAF
jgi:hypothetical protein